MTFLTPSNHQIALIKHPIESKIFLECPVDTGKTTAGMERLLCLPASGIPAGSTLMIASLKH